MYFYWFMGSRRFSASTKEHYGLYYYGLELIEGLIHVEEKKKNHLWNQFSWECLRIIFVISSGTEWKKNKEFIVWIFWGIIKIILPKLIFPPGNKSWEREKQIDRDLKNGSPEKERYQCFSFNISALYPTWDVLPRCINHTASVTIDLLINIFHAKSVTRL